MLNKSNIFLQEQWLINEQEQSLGFSKNNVFAFFERSQCPVDDKNHVLLFEQEQCLGWDENNVMRLSKHNVLLLNKNTASVDWT